MEAESTFFELEGPESSFSLDDCHDLTDALTKLYD